MADNYLTFDGSTGFITVPNDAALNVGTGDFSICFWIKPSIIEYAHIMGKLLPDPEDWGGWIIQIGKTPLNDNKLRMRLPTDGRVLL
jgi:hypothetical protein